MWIVLSNNIDISTKIEPSLRQVAGEHVHYGQRVLKNRAKPS